MRSKAKLLLVLLCTMACAGHRYWVGRFVERALEVHAAEMRVTDRWARVHKEVLEVELHTRIPMDAYRFDLELEERYAVLATMAVARSEEVFDQRWSHVSLLMWDHYGGGIHMYNTFGLYAVTLSRADMDRLRAGAVTAEEVPALWHRKAAVKQGPHGEQLEWPEGAAEPVIVPGRR